MSRSGNQNARVHGLTTKPDDHLVMSHFEAIQNDHHYRNHKKQRALSLAYQEASLDMARDHLTSELSKKDNDQVNIFADLLMSEIRNEELTHQDKYRMLAKSFESQNILSSFTRNRKKLAMRYFNEALSKRNEALRQFLEE